jgi:hypothetical protein
LLRKALEEVLLEREEYIETLETCSPQRIDAVAKECVQCDIHHEESTA